MIQELARTWVLPSGNIHTETDDVTSMSHDKFLTQQDGNIYIKRFTALMHMSAPTENLSYQLLSRPSKVSIFSDASEVVDKHN